MSSNKYIAEVTADKKVLRQLNEVTNSAMGERHINYESRLKTYPAEWLTDKDNGRLLEEGLHFETMQTAGGMLIAVPVNQDEWIKISDDTQIPNSMIEALHEDGKTDVYRVINGVIYAFDHVTESPITHYKIKYQDKQPERMFTVGKGINDIMSVSYNRGINDAMQIVGKWLIPYNANITPSIEEILKQLELLKTPQP